MHRPSRLLSSVAGSAAPLESGDVTVSSVRFHGRRIDTLFILPWVPYIAFAVRCCAPQVPVSKLSMTEFAEGVIRPGPNWVLPSDVVMR
jgi:hypothetical protein